ncbi:MAG: AraC family transcriptional regulator [Clostridia bacterium]|nr:AraC family transcriptional regulator [Clostridia bacterium]
MYKYTNEDVFSDNSTIAIQKTTDYCEEPPHTHEFIEIVYILSGEGKHFIDEHEYEVSSGSLLFINYGQVHSFKPAPSMMYMNILLKPEAVSEKIINSDNAFEILSLTAYEDFRTMDRSCPFINFSGKEKFNVEHLIKEMYTEYLDKYSGYDTVLKGYLSVLLTFIFRKMVHIKTINENVISGISKFIENNLDKKLSLEMLATKCFYSPKYFSRIFKDCYGMTVTEFIQKARIEEGCRLLTESLLPIDEIGRSVGYYDNVRFYKYFKKYCGVTPGEYRRKYKI